jgi:hypothetical protein
MRTAFGAATYPARGPNDDDRRSSFKNGALRNEAARHERRWPKNLHDVDSPCETNISQPLNLIKIESEPKLRAD